MFVVVGFVGFLLFFLIHVMNQKMAEGFENTHIRSLLCDCITKLIPLTFSVSLPSFGIDETSVRL